MVKQAVLACGKQILNAELSIVQLQAMRQSSLRGLYPCYVQVFFIEVDRQQGNHVSC